MRVFLFARFLKKVLFIHDRSSSNQCRPIETIQHCSQSATMIFLLVLPDCDPNDSTFLTTSMPSLTWPKTTCFPSSHWVLAVQRKNWLPLVLGPALAMERIPGPVCFRVKFSSGNLLPKMDLPPVPLWLVKSPPWHMNPGMTLWKEDPLNPNPFSPVHRALKFSEVLGTTSGLRSMVIRPRGAPSAVMSKKHLQAILRIRIRD